MATHTITTTAVGQASAPPNKVNLRFEVTATAPDVASARREVAREATLLREVLTEIGIPADQSRTDRFRLTQRPPPGENPSESDYLFDYKTDRPGDEDEDVFVDKQSKYHRPQTLAYATALQEADPKRDVYVLLGFTEAGCRIGGLDGVTNARSELVTLLKSCIHP